MSKSLLNNCKITSHEKIKGEKKMSNMRKLGTCLTIVVAAIITLMMMPDAYAAGLTGVANTPTVKTAGATTTHTVGFTTATDGAIKSVDITFPAGFDVSGVAAGAQTNIGAGTVAAVGQVVTYTVTADPAPVVNAATAVTIPLTGIVNNNVAAATYTVTVETKDAAPATIDGPTDSAAFDITADVFAKLQVLAPGETADPGTTTGKTGTATVQDAGTGFNITVNAVDQYWNLVTTPTNTINITSTDPAATLPAPAAFDGVTGQLIFAVTLNTVGVWGITASEDPDDVDIESGSTSVSTRGINFTQLSVYKTDTTEHYNKPDKDHATRHGAVLSPTNTLPILGLEIAGDTTVTKLQVLVGEFHTDVQKADLWAYAPGEGEGKVKTWLSTSPINSEGKATFTLFYPLAAGNYAVTIDVKSGLQSHKLDMAVTDIESGGAPLVGTIMMDGVAFTGTPSASNRLNPAGYAQIDTISPSLVSGSYNIGYKILTLQFSDGPGSIANPRINVVDRSDGKAVYKVTLSSLAIRKANNESPVSLGGATLVNPVEFNAQIGAGATLEAAFGAAEISPGEAISAAVETAMDGDTVMIRLTSAQDASVQNNVIPSGPEVYIGGNALYDYVFSNGIAATEKGIATEGDNTPPVIADGRAAKFNASTNILTLTFKESIDATSGTGDPTPVDFTKLKVRNYKLSGEGIDGIDNDGDSEIDEADEQTVVIDQQTTLAAPTSATLTEGYGTTVTIELNSNHKNILLGNQPEIVIEWGAVKDVAGNYILDTNANDILDVGEDASIFANVSVTPPSLSNVESEYKGVGSNMARLILTFSNALERAYTNPGKITIANAATGGDSFSLLSSELADPAVQSGFPAESVVFDLNDNHRNTIAAWQKDKNLYIRLAEDTILDKETNYNAPASTGERIKWVYDNAGPDLVSGSYSHTSQRIKLNFDEAIRVDYGDNFTPDATKVTIYPKVLNPGTANEAPNTTKASAFSLTKGEMKSGQSSGQKYFYFDITEANRDKISSWQVHQATASSDRRIIIEIASGAVQDISKYPRGADSYSSNVDDKIEVAPSRDTARPILQTAVYSPTSRRFSIKFNEPIGAVNWAKVIVYSPSDSTNMTVETQGSTIEFDTVMITVKAADKKPHIILTSVAPQIDLQEGAVADLAGNDNLSKPAFAVTKDSVPPTLIAGGKYEHLNPNGGGGNVKGRLTLKFEDKDDIGGNGKIDVSTLNLAKVTLKAGLFSLTLDDNIAARTTTQDGLTIVVDITDANKVYDISGWGTDETISLYVSLEAEAVADTAGNRNSAVEEEVTWTKDTAKPLLKANACTYVHEDADGNSTLALAFRHSTKDVLEQMDTSSINASGIELAKDYTGGPTISLSPDEIKVPQDFSSSIIFHLTADNRDTISDWSGESGATVFHIRIVTDNAVMDRAGNYAARMPTRQAIAAANWTKDAKKPEFDSAAYNAASKVLTINMKEYVDTRVNNDNDAVDETKLDITDKDGNVIVSLPARNNATRSEKTLSFTIGLTATEDMAVKELGEAGKKLKLVMAADAVKDIGGNGNAAATKDIAYTTDNVAPVLGEYEGKIASHYYHTKVNDDLVQGLLRLSFNESINKAYDQINITDITLSNAASSGESFHLTPDEVRRKQPGDIVMPDAVNQIDVVLSSTHWDMVGSWSTIYLTVAANAVKDSYSGNGIAAISKPIHPNYAHLDATNPNIILTPFKASAPVGEELIIEVTVTDDIKVDTDSPTLYYQIGGGVEYHKPMNMVDSETTNLKNVQFTATIEGGLVTNRGLSYYVLAKDHAGNSPGKLMYRNAVHGDNAQTTNVNVTVTGASVMLPAGKLPVLDLAASPSTYRMLSIPGINRAGDNAKPISDLFANQDVWYGWQFTGAYEYGGYQPGHMGDGFPLTTGHSAWVGIGNPNVDLVVEGDTVNVVGVYKIALKKGWNQIGNPFSFSRNWDDTTTNVDTTPNIMNKIYWFTGGEGYSFASTDPFVPNQTVDSSSWKTAADFEGPATGVNWPGTLDPWGGYWVYTYADTELQIDPMAPGKEAPTPPSAPSVQMPYNWSVKVTPEVGGTAGAAKFAGIVSDATEGIDRYDVMDLPALPGQKVRLSFITEDGDYLQDMKAPADEMFWQFKVGSAANMPVTLRFDASTVPTEYRTVLLLDTVTEAATDLRKAAAHVYKSPETIRNFKLIISKAHPEAYVVPKHSALLQNYPNPFNPETWVPYRLANSGDVTIKVYNVTGQVVRRLELGHREAGSYTVKERAAYWNGRNDIGERVASGVYFYHIQSGSFHTTKRMVILK
jgi:hypothetical protein